METNTGPWQVHIFTAQELQQAIQAITIYTIMGTIIDQDKDTPARGAKLMTTFLVRPFKKFYFNFTEQTLIGECIKSLKVELQKRINGGVVVSEIEAENPSSTCEECLCSQDIKIRLVVLRRCSSTASDVHQGQLGGTHARRVGRRDEIQRRISGVPFTDVW